MSFGPRYRLLVYVTLALSFLVVVWGGVVRVSGSGLGCPDWPLCHGQFLPGLDTATRIEWFHRFLGVAGGLSLAALVAVTIASYRAQRRVLMLTGAYVRGADASTACTTWPLCDDGAFPMFGAAAIHMAHRWVAAVVGVVLLAACWQAWRHRREAPGLGTLASSTAVAFVAQIAVGAANPLSGFSPWALGAHPALASLVWCLTVALTVVAWRPALPRRELVSDMVALTKPAIMSLLLLTAIGAMFLAARGVPPFSLLAATLVGGAAASGGASALNHYFDRDIDELMRRTRRRPLPAHRVPDEWAIGLGIVLNIIAFAVLAVFANILAAALATAGTLFYILVYTLWL